VKRHPLLAALGLCLPLASTLVGQASAWTQQLPDSVYGFSLTDTTTLSGTAGKAYRYQNAAKVRADVFVYAVPADRIGSPDSVQLASESELFVAGLASGIDRGDYDTYQVPVNSTVNVDTKTESSIPGHVVVMVFRRGNDTFVSFMHLFVMDQTYVKVRLTLPSADWETSMAPNFALELAKRPFP